MQISPRMFEILHPGLRQTEQGIGGAAFEVENMLGQTNRRPGCGADQLVDVASVRVVFGAMRNRDKIARSATGQKT